MNPRAPAEPPNDEGAPRLRLREVLRVVEHFLAAAGLVLILYHLGFDLSVMTSPSMAPTLQGTCFANGDWVLTEKVSYWFRQPRRWEVVTLRNGDGVQIMKRVVGLPREGVSMRKGEIQIDGHPLTRPGSLAGLKYYSYGNIAGDRVVNCGHGYYLLGDDSKDSQDSRYEGPYAPEQLRGRAWFILWPLARIGWVNP